MSRELSTRTSITSLSILAAIVIGGPIWYASHSRQETTPPQNKNAITVNEKTANLENRVGSSSAPFQSEISGEVYAPIRSAAELGTQIEDKRQEQRTVDSLIDSRSYEHGLALGIKAATLHQNTKLDVDTAIALYERGLDDKGLAKLDSGIRTVAHIDQYLGISLEAQLALIDNVTEHQGTFLKGRGYTLSSFENLAKNDPLTFGTVMRDLRLSESDWLGNWFRGKGSVYVAGEKQQRTIEYLYGVKGRSHIDQGIKDETAALIKSAQEGKFNFAW